jgi:hypothetical protein
MSTTTPTPSPNGEFHPGSVERQAKEVRMHTISSGLYGLFASLVSSYGYDAVTSHAPVPRPPQQAAPAPATPAHQETVPAYKGVSPVSVEIAAGERSMLEDDREGMPDIDAILRMIDELHEEEK